VIEVKRLPRISAVAILLLLAPLVAGLVAMPLLWCIRVWHWPDWLVALLSCLISAGLMYGIWRLVVEFVQRGFRFSLRTMIVAISIFGLLLGTIGAWWVRFASQYRAVHQLMAYGAVYDRFTPGSEKRPTVYRVFGFDPFEMEHDLTLTNDRVLSEVLRNPEELSNVAQLSFNRGVTATGFAEATGWNRLPAANSVEFIESTIDSAGLKRIAEWRNLRQAFFNGCPQVTDAGLAELTGLPQLESLALFEEGGGMKIGDAGLAHIENMKSLKTLAFKNMRNTTDAGFAHLLALKNLEVLSIQGCGLTESGLRELHEALPNCRIETDLPVDGPRNIRQIMLRRLTALSAPLKTIDDSVVIAKILKLADAVMEQDKTRLEPRFEDQPRAAEFELDFKGESRTLWQARFNYETLQEENIQKQWNRWQLTPEQAAELRSLVGASD
jgi:hypothetical protein